MIREVFITKPGQASKLAKLMKEVMPKSLVMTDVTGVFNKVVVATEIENLAAFEERMKEYSSNKNKGAEVKMKGYTDMYTSGKREIYRVVD